MPAFQKTDTGAQAPFLPPTLAPLSRPALAPLTPRAHPPSSSLLCGQA